MNLKLITFSIALWTFATGLIFGVVFWFLSIGLGQPILPFDVLKGLEVILIVLLPPFLVIGTLLSSKFNLNDPSHWFHILWKGLGLNFLVWSPIILILNMRYTEVIIIVSGISLLLIYIAYHTCYSKIKKPSLFAFAISSICLINIILSMVPVLYNFETQDFYYQTDWKRIMMIYVSVFYFCVIPFWMYSSREKIERSLNQSAFVRRYKISNSFVINFINFILFILLVISIFANYFYLKLLFRIGDLIYETKNFCE